MEKTKGYRQLQAIIGEIMEAQDYPSWDFINNVLSCKKILGEKKLWFWFGNLRIAEEGMTKAGDMLILDEWNTEEDGTITLLGIKDKE